MSQQDTSDNLDFVFVKDLQQIVRHKLAEAVHECCHLVPDAVAEAPLHHQSAPTTKRFATVGFQRMHTRRILPSLATVANSDVTYLQFNGRFPDETGQMVPSWFT